jgi:hypothetical protein
MSKEYLKFQKGDIAALKKIEGIVAYQDSFDADLGPSLDSRF